MIEDRYVFQEVMILHPAKCADFELVRPVAHGTQGSVFAVRCTLDGLPPNKLYALKIFYHDKPACPSTTESTQGESEASAASQLPCGQEFEAFRTARQNEWRTLSKSLRHPNIIRIWTCFEDNVTDQLWKELPEHACDAIEASSSSRGGRLAQFVVFDHHEQSVADYIKNCASINKQLPYAQAKKWALQLLDVACFLREKLVVHSDLKLEHLLLTSNHDIVVTGFSRAKHFKEHYFLPYRTGMTGLHDNSPHQAPEVHNQINKLLANESHMPPVIDYGGQTCWAIGVLIYESLMHCHPLPEYPEKYVNPETRQIEYKVEEVAKPLPSSYSEEFNSLVMELLHADPLKRLDVAEAKKRLHAIYDGSVHYLLTKCQEALEEEKKKSAQLAATCDKLSKEKSELVRNRIKIVTERKELVAERDQLKKEVAEREEEAKELRASLAEHEDNPLAARLKECYTREEELKQRWMELNREREEAIDSLDMRAREVSQLKLEVETFRVEKSEIQERLSTIEAQRQQLETEMESMHSRFADLSFRERKSISESKQAKEGHLLTMRELEEARRKITSLQDSLTSTQQQLREREMQVVLLRGNSTRKLFMLVLLLHSVSSFPAGFYHIGF